MPKLIVICGITGNQGGSVAQQFLKDSSYRIRGVTRNPSSSAAQALKSQGIEVVAADMDDASTLIPAFAGANLIFSVTNYWEPFFRPDCVARAAEQGITPARYAYDVEYAHGKNIADAAATTVDTLDDNGFIVSTLSSARDCSGGKYQELYHFDSKADIFPAYVEAKHPALARKMSCVHTGYFMTSYRLIQSHWFAKQSDGTYKVTFPVSSTKPVPHLDVNADTGPFVYAVARMPPGHAYMCAGASCSWSDYAAIWSRVTGKQCVFQEISLQQMIDTTAGGKVLGRELGEMFTYSSEPGYDGGMKLLWADDLRKAGIECPMTSLEEFMKRQDWAEVMGGA